MTTIAAILKAKGTEVVSVAPEDSAVAVVGILTQRRIGAVFLRQLLLWNTVQIDNPQRPRIDHRQTRLSDEPNRLRGGDPSMSPRGS